MATREQMDQIQVGDVIALSFYGDSEIEVNEMNSLILIVDKLWVIKKESLLTGFWVGIVGRLTNAAGDIISDREVESRISLGTTLTTIRSATRE